MTCKSSQWLQSRERCYFKIQLNGARIPPRAPACSASPLLTQERKTLLRQGFTEQPEGEAPQNRRMERTTTEHPELDGTGPTRIIQSSSWQLTTALVLCRESPSVGAGGVSKAHVDSTSCAGCQRRGRRRGTRLPSWLRKRRRSVLHARVTGSTGN